MVRDVVRVIIREESGFLSEPSEAYAERLQVDRRSVSYEYRPRSESERNPGRKWTYRTDSPAFALIFDELASAAAVALREPREPMCCYIGPTRSPGLSEPLSSCLGTSATCAAASAFSA